MLDSDEYSLALDLASDKAGSIPDLCRQSSDFLFLASRACAGNRQWALAQLLSLRSLSVNTFTRPVFKQSALAYFAFTAGCDLVLRVIPETPMRLRPDMIQRIEEVLSWFPQDDGNLEIVRDLKSQFLFMVTGYCDFPLKIKKVLLSHLEALQSTCQTIPSVLNARIKQLKRTQAHDWVLQIDASEVGNEARYANHADYPNAILVKRPSSYGKDLPHIVALRTINEGDEITINYGSAYWKYVKPGTDPLLLGQIITHPFTDCIYYDGVVEDFSCSQAPGGFLIPPTSSEKRTRRSHSLQVKQVPLAHPAFPGFGLFSKREFRKGDIICIYGGIIDQSPHSGRHASKYAVDLTSDPGIGPFGFTFDPSTLIPREKQRFLPFITDFPDISLPSIKGDENLLSGIVSIADLGEQVSGSICRALIDPRFRETMIIKLKEIKPPFERPTKKEMQNWKRSTQKVFSDTFTRPPIVSESLWNWRRDPEHEFQILLEN